MPPAAELLRQWRADLAAWAIPEHITAAVTESPWVLPRQVFARRADRLAARPGGLSFERARQALGQPGSVLDVGTGAGAACLPLADRCTALTAVDADAGMLGLLRDRAQAAGLRPVLIHGGWPEVAGQAGQADLVTCFHVVYNVPDIGPFLAALHAAARRRVVVEMTTAHPLTPLNDLWLRFHGLRRPQRPTADDLLAILAAMGITARHERWQRPAAPDWPSFAELTDSTRRQLCLPPDRSAEVASALIDSGVDPEHPAGLGSARREVVTVWWDNNGSFPAGTP